MRKGLLFTAALLMLFVNIQSAAAMGRNENGATGDNNKTWEFYSAVQDPTVMVLSDSEANHRLGKKIAYFYELFKETYVVKEEVVPGDPMRRTVIRKPDIYNAVRSIEKNIARSVKKNELSQAQAEKDFGYVLKVALAAIDSETDSFEKALNEQKDSQGLLAVFHNVNLKSLY